MIGCYGSSQCVCKQRLLPAVLFCALLVFWAAQATAVAATPPPSDTEVVVSAAADAPGATATSAVVAVAIPAQPPEVRIKDITHVLGARDNQLVGLGLVVGLNGTGDGPSSQASVEMATNMLRQFGVTVNPSTMRTRNTAAVMVTATLPAFSRAGTNVDVTIASLGDARSLAGGLLLQTPLQGADGQIYAVAQGLVTIGGQSSGAARTVNTHSLTGTVAGGAIVEKELPATLLAENKFTLVLASPDFSTASRVAAAVNKAVGAQTARALDNSNVEVTPPAAYRSSIVDFLAAVGELPVQPDAPARVVVNERTGTVVIGGNVRVAPVAVAHGQLSVRVAASATSTNDPAQQSPWPVAADRSDQTVLLSGASVGDVVQGLNAIGATPKDIIALLQAIKAAGALFGDLVVM